MDHYLDIGLRPDPEFSPAQLMNALFGKLHRALAGLPSPAIGISFPDVQPARPALGDRMRLHGSAAGLHQLLAQPWLTGLSSHVQLGDVTGVPDEVQYRNVCRIQVKSSAERLRRRLMRRHSLTADEAQQRIPDSVESCLTLPFISLRSQSTEQAFRLFIHHGPLQKKPRNGTFNAYGLGHGATIPWFE
ncbi:type I-F CRISPR-associated endoribonuclease Cas6/Csy4 [Pseudomonas sp. CCI3.2]|uniref:type I-F CRISPR-associated endoribonuclease Cas6/Csy4 n=1 Tax=unclassified Pseudomonas TaxID=196821 RepID=UPI002AC96175|nr:MULTISPECIES: type I-F CRISPR-associated endoribonuclease Cas6/Csy4 [unclassified Pseudomonas]MEB0077986.1 type I-F CRISPR-associated endoribonuclease Cas6/Csy4 [Pseudomonas sp. MH10out]MEB0089981.1 type I-F CRISPR-associated endoribonuclease Cas6/Csy4 [Pseudomonas sp. CCI4.2]MEB0104342.1 type I-F CRISPR-associated endoribonuclease Cas6/Csy4 [Pseudomonas sp. CCI3.2]MEB0133160.1 type I-F CRISPR-associated endoribonuclease Cas6/Csy4 [Pseudomonas sp. CCI2.4]MEB0158878.1 type I-F CRISPR-associa